MQRLDFMRAIRESPDDDAPRLIYADWLEEQGDNDRAEFIRNGCEMYRTEVVERNRNSVSLHIRQIQLRNQHGRDWWPWSDPWPVTWERGFVRDARMSGLPQSFERLEESLAEHPLRLLQLVMGMSLDGSGRISALQLRHPYLQVTFYGSLDVEITPSWADTMPSPPLSTSHSAPDQ